jgi:hypothetical protein
MTITAGQVVHGAEGHGEPGTDGDATGDRDPEPHG